MSSYYSLLYQQIGPIDSLKVVSADAFMYVSNTGNDTSGTGSTAAPFRTLKKAVSFAREHLILGDATLTIRLLPGEYTIDENLDLYHPQGANLVIEGDPDSFRQRTVFQVQNYSWNIGSFAGGGHTGTLSLFDGSATAGTTLHGFTGTDTGTYFTITNAAIGSRSGYSTVGGGISAPSSYTYSMLSGLNVSSQSSYNPIFYGDRFFNHGYSYEEGNAILGIGRLVGVTASATTVSAQFSNLNYDGRCPAWHENGGIGNSTTWGGIASNYPETQYSQPNGYYGNSSWKNESGNVAYPSKPGGTVHITPDPFVLSTYPVVLRCSFNRNRGSLYLKNGTLKALRNLFFAADSTPFTLNSGATGATLNYSQSISAFSDNGLPHDNNGVALSLENATIGIRHLGFLGAGTAISAQGSRIVKYSESTTNQTLTTESDVLVRRASPNSLDNAPILSTAHCQNGIVAKNSTIDFTDGSGTDRKYLADYRDSSVHISAASKPISLFGSELKATSIVANTNSMVSGFKMEVVVPVFAGMSSSGGVNPAFIAYAGNTAFWSAYPMAKAYMRIPGGTRREIGFINQVTESPSQEIASGTTVGAFYISGVQPTQYRRYVMHGLKTAPDGLSYITTDDVRGSISPMGVSLPAATLEVEFFSGISSAQSTSFYALGRSSVLVRGLSGTTYGITGITNGQLYFVGMSSFGADGTYLGNFFQNRKTTLQAFDGSDVVIEKALIIDNGGAVPVEIAKNSSVVVGDGIVSANKTINLNGSQDSGQTDGTLGSINYNTGFICITGYAQSGIHCWDNSSLVLGTLFIKHPTPVGCFATNSTDSSNGKIMRIEQSSRGVVGSLYSLSGLAVRNVLADSSSQIGPGHWQTFRSVSSGTGFGFVPFDSNRLNGLIIVEKNSSLILELGVGRRVFHFDGGSPNWSAAGTSSRNASLLTAKTNSSILVGDAFQAFSAYTEPTGTTFANNTRFMVDLRTGSNQKIATRNSTSAQTSVYNTAGVTRPWNGDASANTKNYIVNIGNYGYMLTNGIGEKDLVPASGVTYCTSFSGFSRIIGI